MHELSLYGQVSKLDYDRLRQQLAGVTRMQPQDLEEVHLVFKARTPPGLDKAQSMGGSQGVQQQDAQKLRTMLNSGIHYVQLIGEIKFATGSDSQNAMASEDIDMSNDNERASVPIDSVNWSFEFKDTPESGKQIVSSRLISRLPFEKGDLVNFMTAFGYEYVSRYYVRGCKFYDQDTIIRLSRILQLPSPSSPSEACNISNLGNPSIFRPFDTSGSYMIQSSLSIIDGNNQDLKDRGIKQLLAMKETLRPTVDLTPGDRLAMDTRIAVQSRR